VGEGTVRLADLRLLSEVPLVLSCDRTFVRPHIIPEQTFYVKEQLPTLRHPWFARLTLARMVV